MSKAGLVAMQRRPLVSPITVWELRYKAALGKLPPLPLTNGSFVQHLTGSGFQMAGFDCDDGERGATLPLYHRDPMDRMLIASALRLGCSISICDDVFAPYGMTTVW